MNDRIAAGADAFAALAQSPVDATVKGIPPAAGLIALQDIGKQGWNLLAGDVPLPAAVLDMTILAQNSQWMRSFIETNGLAIAPHGKTTMAPQLFKIQQGDGAWGMTVATIQQFAVCRRFGFDRVLLANEPIGRVEIDYLFAELRSSPVLELYCLVDSIKGVERIAEAGSRSGNSSRLQLLIEVGIRGGRAGCRTIPEVTEIALRMKELGLTLRGIEGFEGVLSEAEAVDGFLGFMCDAALACAKEGLFAAERPIILSAGGSAFYDMVAARLVDAKLVNDFLVVARSGCYLTHDSLIYEKGYRALRKRAKLAMPPGDLQPALSVWTHVQSRPEADRAILAMGRRDVSFDAGLPIPLRWFRSGLHSSPMPMPAGHNLTALNDQHAYLSCPPGSPLDVGDVIAFGISHPCTTLDKWQVVLIADGAFDIVDAVRTFF